MVPLTIGLIALVIVLVVVGALLSRRGATEPAPRPAQAERPARPEPIAKRLTSQLTPPKPARPGGYDWDRRTHQLYRAWKRVPGPEENRDAILAFLDDHTGVEAFVEPRTVMHPLSVVLVDAEGQWGRFELKEDAFLRELARERGVPVFDASRVGYPPRMRRRRPEDDEDEDRS
ncbi:MAG: hypothetical protein ACXVQU_09715 [Actinomycetota bacterium]